MNYAHKKGVEVIGDIPMYVSDDSADAWSEPENFWLSDTGKAIEISGAPPDNFAPEGQVWGNPTFRWDRMKENGYRWWMDRLRRAFSLYDRVRLTTSWASTATLAFPPVRPVPTAAGWQARARTCSRPPMTSWVRSTLSPRIWAI